MPSIARFVISFASALIVLGGLYDIFAAQLPQNLKALCGENESARRLSRELLRALGGSLVAIGTSVAVMVNRPVSDLHQVLLLVLLLILPSEGLNAICMFRVRSFYFVPLGFILLSLLGVAFAVLT